MIAHQILPGKALWKLIYMAAHLKLELDLK